MRWPRFHRPRVDLDAIVEEYGQALLADAKMMGPVVYDPRMWVRVMLDDPALLNLDATADSEPYDGGLTWEQFSASMQAVEGTYRDALSGGHEPGFPTNPEVPRWLRAALDEQRESGKLEP